MEKKKVFILGSTGSIGVSALDVIRLHKNSFEVVGLTANRNIDLLLKQIHEFNPKYVVVKEEYFANLIKNNLPNGIILLDSDLGLITATRDAEYDILLSALVGFAGLQPTIEGIKKGKRIALANKETLVVAGELITKLARHYNSELIPVDSEHSAIFQCLVGEKDKEIEKLILTASGGPFFSKSKTELENVTVAEALNHPNWNMGSKVTIDSATMMNKGLEMIEAHWLFNLPASKIDVIIHPQSIIHSMVEFIDGSIKAQLSQPDMRLPIQYALTYPNRMANAFTNTKLTEIKSLTFHKPDFTKFECLQLAFDVLERGGTAPAILNAANEIAVERFLKNEISFTAIPEMIKNALNEIEIMSNSDLETIIEHDSLTRKYFKV
ncbi:MAG: 1-deoxy-D-xylulose-5-phosphate reductoisomerase [Bacteroidetes bacterium]|nr:1-deoxy-D-xylulose-5-phosphate reductoisomerase [Bacteroidota bacterium]MBU1116655.1 1-deoxy-D-xylulose-5-phosphate reductoisomerase [Bacteroidota bacterium]MBU1797494.1 1-deoxy-D-xylulose-5-phosphate reductoisomerase [Bacteroidota bacterium]